MIFTETEIKGAYIIDLEKRSDDRGYFARAFCANKFADHGLKTEFVQANISFNYKKGTVRGLHYQLAPHQETKFFRCISGAMYDVFIDLRPESATYLKWIGVELSVENKRALYVPAGCANGYQALQDNTEALYYVDAFYTPGAEKQIRWDDPTFNIKWPITKGVVLSDKDKSTPDFVKQS